MNQKLKKGTKVIIKMNDPKDKLNKLVGIVKYIGPIDDKKNQGDYVGIEIDKDLGKNDGTYKGKQYFKTRPNHGLFLKPSSLLFMNGTPVSGVVAKSGPGKLSKDLGQMMVVENQDLKKQLEQASMKIKELESTDWKKQNDELKVKIRELEEINKSLKLEGEKIKYAVSDKDDERIQELNQKMQFFKTQKEAVQKQKAQLRKKNSQLTAQLQQFAADIEMAQQNAMKIQQLKQKNQKLKQQLQSVNLQMRNLRISGNNRDSQSMSQQLKILNETVTLLQSQLNEQRQKKSEMQLKLQNQQKKMGQMKKLQFKVRSKDQQLQLMAAQIQANSDAAAYAQKLILDNLKKDDDLKQVNVKINEYIKQVQKLQQQISLGKQLQNEMDQQLFNQQQLMQTYLKQAQQKNNHIQQLNRQIEKYKKKICQLTQSTQSMISSITLGQQSVHNRQQQFPKSMMNIDVYQNKYYKTMKIIQNTNAKFLKNQIQFSQMRNQVGVYMLNLNQALPQSFTSKLYPQVISVITSIKSTNDKLYYIFQASIDNFKNKPDIYSKDNQQLCQWLILLMTSISLLYSSLQKLQISLTTSQTQQQLSQILTYSQIPQWIGKIDRFSIQLLQNFSQDNITSSINLQLLQQGIQNLDKINGQINKKFSSQYDMKMKLCQKGMQLITKTYSTISQYKLTSQLGQNAQVDNLLQNFINVVSNYLFECCMNPYIRYKADMGKYKQGIQNIIILFQQIRCQKQTLLQLSSLYSQTQYIKMLKDTILNSQYFIKQLLSDLDDIIYPNTLSKLQTQLPGKVWINRIKNIKDELLRVRQVIEQKKQLQLTLTQKKKKILQLQKQLKDKQNTKQLYQKRIGQLQLKVQQSISIENQNKRQIQKIKSYQQTNKLIQQQIGQQSKKRKLLQQQLKKVNQKYNVLQTQVVLRNKRPNKNSQNISSQDVSNLTIFKNAIKQSNTLRNIQIKKKLIQLKQSPLFSLDQQQNHKHYQQLSKRSSLRRKGLNQLSKLQVFNPFVVKQDDNTVIVDNLFIQASKLQFTKNQHKGKQKSVQVGNLIIDTQGNQNINLYESINEIIGY